MKMTSAATDGRGTPCYSIKWKYGVHICFNGQEIENSLIGFFKHAFCKRGIKTTIDDLKNARGEEISQTAVKAIQESRSSIVVFCAKFPFNRRCLDELVTILDCKRRYGQLLQPVFFQIAPTVIRNRRGCYEEALAEHLRKFKNEMEVKRWELTLHDVANLHGWPFKSCSESQFIQEIVESICMNIHIPSRNADCLAGQLRISDDVATVENGSEGTGAWIVAGLKSFFTSSRRKEPENGKRFIAPSTSTGNATRKRKRISNQAEFRVEANPPQKLKGSLEALSASVGVVDSTLLAVEDAGTVAMRTSEEVKSAMQTVQTYASKSFQELIAEGSEFKEHIKKNVLKFCAGKKISPGMRVASDNLLRYFACWSQDYEGANTVLKTTTADLSKAEKLQANFEAVVNDSEKAVSHETQVLNQLKQKLLERSELEEKLEAVNSEIAFLSSSRRLAAERKDVLLNEGTKLKAEKDKLTVQLPRIMGERDGAKGTQEYIEAEWSKHVQVFNENFKSEFGSG